MRFQTSFRDRTQDCIKRSADNTLENHQQILIGSFELLGSWGMHGNLAASMSNFVQPAAGLLLFVACHVRIAEVAAAAAAVLRWWARHGGGQSRQ